MRKLKRFCEADDLEFGDYILFQEYERGSHDGTQYNYKVSKPILAIYLGYFAADQTMGFNYVIWNNQRHTVYITNQYVTNVGVCKEVDGVHQHIEWNDYLDILGHWNVKPKWKEIMVAYRKQNANTIANSDEIDWSYN